MMTGPMRSALLLLCAAAPLPRAAAQDTVRFTPTVQQPTFAVREPVLRIRPNTVLVSKTNFGDYYTEQGGAFPGEVGPIYVEGATTNDMLVVQVIRVQPNYHLAASNVRPTFGGLSADSRLRVLNDPIPSRRYVWHLDTTRMTGTTELPNSRLRTAVIDLQPMLGRVAVAPRGQEAFGAPRSPSPIPRGASGSSA
jgi:acetamidase/formamidase